MYADGGADFLGNLRLFFGGEDAHNVGYVAVGNDFDARLCGGADAQQRGADFGCVPSFDGDVAGSARQGGDGNVVVYAFGGLFGTCNLTDELFLAFGGDLSEQQQVAVVADNGDLGRVALVWLFWRR